MLIAQLRMCVHACNFAVKPHIGKVFSRNELKFYPSQHVTHTHCCTKLRKMKFNTRLYKEIYKEKRLKRV